MTEYAAAKIGTAVLPLLEATVGGMIAVAGAIAWQIVRDRKREIGRKYREGDLLGIELSQIAEALRDRDWLRSAAGLGYEPRQIPSSVYDGLVGSGRLAYFDRRTQELLYLFYLHGDRGDRESMAVMIGEVIDGVERFKADNAPGARAAMGRFARFATGGRRGASAAGGGKLPAPAGRAAVDAPAASGSAADAHAPPAAAEAEHEDRRAVRTRR